ncbi:MAG: chorismate-binding protein, partial [Micrococcales bacterium]|nr:chorismate-binding protein [Micrococcales bacterium]
STAVATARSHAPGSSAPSENATSTGRGGTGCATTSTVPGTAATEGPALIVVSQARPVDVAFSDGALEPGAWERAVATAVERITAGELDKVVLARDLGVTAHDAIDVRWLLRRLAERYDTTWVFAVDGLVGATPELLVRREKGLVTSRVLAGTIRPTGDDAHDLALAASLARSSKDLEEHEYAVRSVADALAPHCSSMNVPEAPFVLHLSNVMHLATDVAGVLVDDTSSLRLAASLHPSAAVCGTPRLVADEVIAELEHMDRGRYAGPVGWIDADGDGEWGIALRCGAVDPQDPSRMRLFAGCGIVAGSVPADELAESAAKLVPMRDALTA